MTIDARTRPILIGHDAGHYELPAQILKVRDEHARVEEALHKLRTDGNADPEAAMVDVTLELVREGGAVPAGDLLKRATRLTQQAAARDVAIRALVRVQEMAAEEVSAQVQWFGDKVIAALATALDDTIGQARGASAALRGVLPSRDVIAAGLVSEEIRDAYGVLVAQSARYGAIRSARFSLILLGIRSQRDESNIFLEFKNFDAVWPNFHKGGDPPWPADSLERLLWIVSGPAEPWIPTPLEQDARWLEYREAVKARQARPLARRTALAE
ncbi:MAG: hypothetical protein ACRDJV_13515 [Actinomycetota bacterium]